MQQKELVAFWKKTAQQDHKTAKALLITKNYVGSLFFVHLYLEKTVKGLVQKETGKTPPFTHDLLVLSKLAEIQLKKEQETSLAEINTFNIRARYADYKFSFYKKARMAFTVKYFQIAEEIYQWFLKHY